ncbi:MAG: hypothetical protein EBZ49_16465 [Proteobacteria bacterium]|nr:hypothetical protein [Pseudomonadota bacterium]NDC25706.1 hypothetical protein [Pseudomonadota bacterium]
MDHRFPQWLRTCVRKLSFVDLPNLGMVVCGLGIMAYFAQASGFSAVESFSFDPVAIREQGEWWRLFAFPMSDPSSTPSNPLFFFFFVLYTYFVFQSIEAQWGSAPLTLFVGLSYLSVMIGALVLGYQTNLWHYVLLNVSLVFGTLFPNFELLLFFILPVKAKWLTLLSGAVLIFEFLKGGNQYKLFLLFALFPYLLFFGPFLFGELRTKIKIAKNRKNFDKDMWR